jgi:hypothetical protein
MFPSPCFVILLEVFGGLAVEAISMSFEEKRKIRNANAKANIKGAKEDKKEERYNEREITRRFLNSEDGVTFLIDKAKKGRAGRCEENPKEKDMDYYVNEVIDFYVSWVKRCGSKRIIRGSQYECMKGIEDYCLNSDVRNFFEYLFY